MNTRQTKNDDVISCVVVVAASSNVLMRLSVRQTLPWTISGQGEIYHVYDLKTIVFTDNAVYCLHSEIVDI